MNRLKKDEKTPGKSVSVSDSKVEAGRKMSKIKKEEKTPGKSVSVSDSKVEAGKKINKIKIEEKIPEKKTPENSASGSDSKVEAKTPGKYPEKRRTLKLLWLAALSMEGHPAASSTETSQESSEEKTDPNTSQANKEEPIDKEKLQNENISALKRSLRNEPNEVKKKQKSSINEKCHKDDKNLMPVTKISRIPHSKANKEEPIDKEKLQNENISVLKRSLKNEPNEVKKKQKSSINEECHKDDKNLMPATKISRIPHSSAIKEEPIDKEKLQNENISVLKRSLKDEPNEVKKKQKSSINEECHKDDKNLIPATKISRIPHSSGQKKTLSSSTVLQGQKKSYDPKLVIAPFAKGWKREHVIRSTSNDTKTASDIYYFSPEGRKLRSKNDISNYLKAHQEIGLKDVNFTFVKQLIYKEPYEFERVAKKAGSGERKSFKPSENIAETVPFDNSSEKKFSDKSTSISQKSPSANKKGNVCKKLRANVKPPVKAK